MSCKQYAATSFMFGRQQFDVVQFTSYQNAKERDGHRLGV